MTAKIGWKIKANKKRRAVTIEVSPVLPPSATPDALSTNVVTVDVPSIAPTVVPIESAKRACLALGKFPSLSNISAFDATLIISQNINMSLSFFFDDK